MTNVVKTIKKAHSGINKQVKSPLQIGIIPQYNKGFPYKKTGKIAFEIPGPKERAIIWKTNLPKKLTGKK